MTRISPAVAQVGAALAPKPPKRTPAPTPPTVYRPWTQQQLYLFIGSLTNVAEIASFAFYVLAGEGAPTITSGWAKINIIDRPQRKGFTVPAGYDPITLDIPVLFESWVRQPPGQTAIPNITVAGNLGGPQPVDTVENDIQKLEWMAGRGKLYSSNLDFGVGAPAAGDPPLVAVRSINGQGAETNLIPPNLHGVRWIVSSISYGEPLRDREGDRRRQPATVTLTEFVAAAGLNLDSPSTRAKARNTVTGFYPVLTTSALNTIGKIVETYVFDPTWQAKLTVLAANKNEPTIRIQSVNQALPVGLVILIPQTLRIVKS